ncbi:ArgS-related anticodon-binding protein NrtL [Streptomyces albidoflavus]|uniref:ArgS-related anticodon-binding protein NrtL n=1 Tax=Streptomyces albidoflavus TaxID=1886 RepID=UPI00214928EB|nr:DALR anticodon-binding domain-containing protein [Streptomyces albidoflavus]MCR0989030.1 DALR anticodon-binding domain-containing protein [Streptomyces albidoflavus]
MTPADLSLAVLSAVRSAVDGGELAVAVPERVVVERPGPGGAGEWASNVALRLAREAGRPPREVADVLRGRLVDAPGIAGVEVTGPGFLNVTLAGDFVGALVARIGVEGEAYGWGDALRGAGPVAVPDGTELRARVVAEAAGRLVRAQGGSVRGGGAAPVPAGAGRDEAVLGADGSRWALLHPAPHDVAHGAEVLEQRARNPLFRVRYAHARSRGLVAGGAALGVVPGAGPVTGEAARVLTGLLGEQPAVLVAAARKGAPDRLARQLVTLADAFFDFHDSGDVLPRGGEKPGAAHRSRLALAEAAGTVLAGGLSLLGISAPDHL